MIKLLKISFFILLIRFFGLLGNSFVNAGYSDIITKPNGQLIEQGQGGIKFQVSGNGTLLSQYLGLSRRVLAFEGGNPKVYFWWGLNGVPYAYYYYSNDNVNLQGYYNNYQVCDELTGGSVSVSNCVTYDVNTGSFYESLTPFFNSVKSSDYFGYSYGWYVATIRTYYLRVCFSSNEFGQSVCFMTSDGLSNSLGLEQNISFGDLSQSIIGNPPGYSYGGGNIEGGDVVISGEINLTGDLVYSEIGTGDVIDYFNSVYGFNSSICYVGTNDLSSPFGTNGISFDEGSGATIFDLYYNKFGNWSGVTNGLQYVANMIDAWTINYYNWFMTDRNPSYLVDFNGQLYTKFYDMGSGLSFPFSNNPVAYYFMADNIWHYSNFYGDSSHLIGNEVVDYCNMLLNGSTIDDMISQGSKSDIIGNYNRNKTTPENLANWKVDGSSWSGVFSSGTIITDGTDFINNFFNKVKGSLIIPNKDGGQNGIVPGYILICMFALILFRLISH